MSPAYGSYPVADAKGVGDEISSSDEGRILTLLESDLVHPTHTDGLVDVRDPIVSATGTPAIVGVARIGASAATQRISIDTEGIYNLDVVAADDNGNIAVAGGDVIYINTTTAVLSKIRNLNTQVPFGYALGIITSGNTEAIAVKVHWMLAVQPLQMGSSSDRITSTVAGLKFLQLYFENSAASGDNRGMYLRLYLTGGGGGEAARIFTTVEDVVAGTAHGAHISLNWGTTGSITGLGVAMRATLHLANMAYTGLGGTYSAIMGEIWSDGATTDPVGITQLALLSLSIGGNASGIADVDDDAYAIVIAGGTIGAGNMVQTDVDETKFSHKVKCYFNGTLMYLMCADS